MPVTNYIWDVASDNLLMETDDSGATTAVYTNEPDVFGDLVPQRRGGASSYYHFDAQRSTRELTDAHQNVTDVATYTTFGETVASSGVTSNPFGYKGALGYYVNPETNDLCVRERTYEPKRSQWLSRAPTDFVQPSVTRQMAHTETGTMPQAASTDEAYDCKVTLVCARLGVFRGTLFYGRVSRPTGFWHKRDPSPSIAAERMRRPCVMLRWTEAT